MNCQELATVSVENLNTKVFILNNQYLGMVMQVRGSFPSLGDGDGCAGAARNTRLQRT